MQLWNNLSFDLQKTDIDEQIDLVLTSGNMLKQDEQAKMEKFIETMPTIIQMHLIIAPNWEEVTKKAKNLEHIIGRCEPLAIAPPISQDTGVVPSLYSHKAQSQNQDSMSLPKSFKSARGHRGKKSKGKVKPQQQLPPSPLPPKQEEQYKDANNYYHNENYKGNNRGHRPYSSQYSSRKPYRGSQQRGRDNKIIIQVNTKATTDNLIPPVVAIIIITMAIIKAEMAVAMVVTIIDHVVTEEAITEAITIINTINITCMRVDPSSNNMVHHALFAEVSIILLNIVLKENMTSII